MRGEVVHFYAYDAAYEIDMAAAKELLRSDAALGGPATSRRGPRDYPFYRPLIALQNAVEFPGKTPASIRREARIFSVGAVSVSLRLDIEADSLAGLLPQHELALPDGRTLQDLADEACAEVRGRLAPAMVKPASAQRAPEDYSVFLLAQDGGEKSIRDWLAERSREAAGLLIGEPAFRDLSDEEVRESLRLTTSYTKNDLFIVDWNSALILDPERDWEELLYVIEVANLQLSELKSYDGALERFLDQAYDDLASFSRNIPLWRSPGPVVERLREMLMDLTKTAEEVTNITKFFGDWHLARAYMACRERFHLTSWENAVERKLGSLDSMYRRVSTEQSERRMLVLEAAIVLLFIADLAIIFSDMLRKG